MCAVCSKTLWIGHLNRHTTEQELNSELSQFGEISSTNVSFASVMEICYYFVFLLLLLYLMKF